jgi:hypothetical protein
VHVCVCVCVCVFVCVREREGGRGGDFFSSIMEFFDVVFSHSIPPPLLAPRVSLCGIALLLLLLLLSPSQTC